MGTGGDVKVCQQGPITLSPVNRRPEEHDKDVTRFRRPRPTLRSELSTAFAAGLREIREELQRVVGREPNVGMRGPAWRAAPSSPSTPWAPADDS
ncbi:hypothetical protein GCM10009760_63130 [Kitasatospora kazusensis]|uniref:Uncharacterized protein n=1 Tax=Kitasatospora kazusensis TaxID=407974 RepID=A0ABN1ZLS7_9ACTN